MIGLQADIPAAHSFQQVPFVCGQGRLGDFQPNLHHATSIEMVSAMDFGSLFDWMGPE